MSDLKKSIIFIDGDNANKFDEGTFIAIFKAAEKYGYVAEAHIFANRQSAKSEKLYDMVTKYAIHFHLLPIKKNSTDISLTIRATEKLYTDDSFENYIIVVAGDHDYMPLATEIRQKGKKAVCFYIGEKDETLLSAFSSYEKVKTEQTDAKNSNEAKLNDRDKKSETACNILAKLEELLKKDERISFQNLGSSCTRAKINYKVYFKTIGTFFSNRDYADMFQKYKFETDNKNTTYISKKQ